MEKQIFNEEIAVQCELAVMNVFECKKENIYCFADSFHKKVVVFILYHFYEFDKRQIGRKYKMTYLYVPTVAKILEDRGKNEKAFNNEINQVLKLMNYGIEEMDQGRRRSA